MRPSSHLVPVVLAGFVAVLVGYASSAAIIRQAAAAAGASAQQIALCCSRSRSANLYIDL